MNRKRFLEQVALGAGGFGLFSFSGFSSANQNLEEEPRNTKSGELKADLVIAGAGVGGCAAALSALNNNVSVILTEETDWIGGQLTQQGVPPDEHPWIETHGATALYRKYRNQVREFYKQNYPLTETARAREYLNPGDGVVSQLCHEPRVSLAVLQAMLLPYLSNGRYCWSIRLPGQTFPVRK